MNAKNFKNLMKELQDELKDNDIILGYSKIQELRFKFKDAKITNPIMGLSWLDFVKKLLNYN